MSDLAVPDPSLPVQAFGAPDRPLSPDERAAVVVYSLGPERAAQILKRMDERDYRRFARAMSRLETVDTGTVEAVLADFTALIDDPTEMRGGAAETRRFLAHFLDSSYVDQLLGDISGPAGRDIWEKLSNTQEQYLFAYLRGEQPQSVAVILSRINAGKAAKVLQLFPQQRAEEIIRRMSRIGNIDDTVMKQLKSTLQREFFAILEKQRGIGRPHDVIGEILNEMPPEDGEAMLEALRRSDPESADMVERALFRFTDFGSRVAAADLQAVIKNCEHHVLIQALALAKENAPDVMEYFFNNMSKRAGAQMQEEMEEASPIRTRDAQEAQQEVVRVAQAMAKAGEIELMGADSESEEVVGS